MFKDCSLKAKRALLLILTICLLIPSACSAQDDENRLTVFIAGSLMIPFDEVEKAYEALHPELDVRMEAHGSIQVIRHVTEIHDEIDVIVPADYALIPMLMYESQVPETGKAYANWLIKYASNRLVLAYRPDSKAVDEINADNWFEIIARPEVKYGLSDPRFDAAGYRSLMVVQLAENYYQDPTIFERVYLGRFKNQIRVEKIDDLQIIHVPEVLETTTDSNIVFRGGSVALLALLESGDVDYAFEYESVAIQHGLGYVTLPDELNLGEAAFAEDYAQVQVVLDFQRFTSVNPVFNGEVIGYGLTIPSNAPHPDEAEAFIAFLLSDAGRKILEDNHHPVFDVFPADGYEDMPADLQEYSLSK
ncbi:MAG: tungstate ABC transporter substrate-binding protein WtpA [Anaerolineaceae bacterium]|nr:tungstate ABC transporter substrate-binding protein WtpA [Anaerolineaceae bacterium]